MSEEKQLFCSHQNNHTDSFGNHYPTPERVRSGTLSYTCVVDMSEIEFMMAFPDAIFSALKRQSPIPIAFGVSICHPEDVFCRKTGRRIAEQRLTSVNAKIVEVSLSSFGGMWCQEMEFFFPSAEITMTVKTNGKDARPRIKFSHSSNPETCFSNWRR